MGGSLGICMPGSNCQIILSMVTGELGDRDILEKQLQNFKSTIKFLAVQWTLLALFPGPAQLSVTCSTEKRGEPGIFSHMSMT